MNPSRLSVPFVLTACLSLGGLAACGVDDRPDDDSLEESVTRRLDAETQLAPFDLDVEADGGIVTLDGTVDSEGQRMEAERIARSTAGVQSVSNQIDVRGGSPPAVGAPPPGTPDPGDVE